MEFAPSLNIIINEKLPALQKVQESGKARFIELLDIHSKAFGIKRYAYLLYFFCLFITKKKNKKKIKAFFIAVELCPREVT